MSEQRVLVDTSVLIDPPSVEELEANGLLAAESAISPISLAELHKGVLLAAQDDERALRLRRLAAIEARHEALPFDTPAARVFGRYMAEAKRGKLGLRVRDAIIAATAEANRLTVLSRDADFQRFGADLVALGGGGR